MASVSKHPVDILVWLEKVLESCETRSQLNTCSNLFNLFEKQYMDNLSDPRHPYLTKFQILDNRRWELIKTIPNQS